MIKAADALNVQEIGSPDTLLQLHSEWTSLWQSSADSTPFQHPSWLIPWWRHFGSDKQLLTLLLRDHGALVGIVPLCILQDHEGRKVMPLGIGLCDYIDALFAPGYEITGAHAVYDHLAQTAHPWDVCDLQPLTRESPLLNITPPENLSGAVLPVDTLTALELPAEFATFQKRLSRHFSDRVREASRRAEKLGSLVFQTATTASFEEIFDHLLRFHYARWRTLCTSDPSFIPNDPVALFHREAAAGMLHRGSLRLYSLTLCERVAAVLYGFVHRQRGYLYMTGYDPQFQKISPGVLLLTHAIKELIHEGATSCDFLRGREPYKYRWGIIERSTYAYRLHKK